MTPSLSWLHFGPPQRLLPLSLLRHPTVLFHTSNGDKPELRVVSTETTPESKLKGISIAYHLKRRQAQEETMATSRYVTTQSGNLEKDLLIFRFPKKSDQAQYYSDPVFASLSLSDRRQELQDRLERLVELQTMRFSSKEYKPIKSSRVIKAMLRSQVEQCMSTKDIFRLVAAAMYDRKSAAALPTRAHGLIRAFYRARTSASDLSIAKKIWVLIKRFDKAGLRVEHVLLMNGLKFAIRSRDLLITRRFLREYRTRGPDMGSQVFRTAVGKCSIGRTGVGEIRNGRWKREDLMQVLLGFPDDPPGQECHLGSFVNRNDWVTLAAWTQILSRCGELDELWKEWIIWKCSDSRRVNKPLQDENQRGIPYNSSRGWKTRGDRWFIQQFIEAGAMEIAWQILKETGLDPTVLRGEPLQQLLERVDIATVWNHDLKQALIQKLDDDLSALEYFMGVKWVTKNGISYHAPTERCHQALEDLSDPQFFTLYGDFSKDS